MWREFGLIGRDKLVRKLERYITEPHASFCLQGQGNVGLTAILEFLHAVDHPGEKSLIDADRTMTDNLNRIMPD